MIHMTHRRLRIWSAFVAALLPGMAAHADLFLENFERAVVGQPPEGWRTRHGNIADVYAVREEGGRKFLHAEANGVAVLIGKEIKYDVKHYPVLSWRWRVHALPTGADERAKKTGDSAAGVYVIFGGWPTPKTLKYVWSSTLPVGTRTASPVVSRTKIVVVESGPTKRGRWVAARVNVLEDYRRLFGEDPPLAKGIGILSDADNTGSRAAADYADIVARTAVGETRDQRIIP